MSLRREERLDTSLPNPCHVGEFVSIWSHMKRRSFLMACAAAVARGWAQSSFGTLVWVEAGSLWIRELPDGRAAKIATAKGLHRPRISLSGKWVAYQDHEDRVGVVRRDGKSGAAATIGAERAAWLPDDRVAVLQEDAVVAYAAQSEWKTGMPLLKGGMPVFAPEGKRFAFARFEGEGSKLFVNDREVVTNEEGEMQVYGWTHDGKWVVYWRAEELSASLWSDGVGLYAVAAEGGEQRDLKVKTLVDRDFLEFAPESTGNRLAVTAGDGRATWAAKRVAVIDLDNSELRYLTGEGVAAFAPAWSPDGRRIAYSAGPDADAAYRKQINGLNIRVMRPDGVVETQVVGPKMKIGVSGGEEAHLYLHQRKLWVVDAEGTGGRQLTGDSRYRDEEPMWSADGERILFGRMDYDGHASLWMMESGGGGAREVCKLQLWDPLGSEESWFGYYGYVDWGDGFDWRR